MTAPIVAVDRVVKRFAGHVAVDGLSLTVPSGVIYGLLGPNGAGKTTTIRMIMNVFAPDEGTPGGWPDQVEQQADGGGLAGAVGPQVAKHLAWLHGEAEARHASLPAIVLGQFLGLDDSHRHAPFREATPRLYMK
jgi:ABC-type cobalamin/Fe3+-siderophores transport system ATPase subunit